MKILLLDTKPSNPNHYICRSIQRALVRHPRVAAVRLVDYGGCAAAAREMAPDLFLAFDGESPHLPIIARTRAHAAHSAIWFTDDPYVRPHNLRLAESFDTVFTNDAASVAAYGAKGHHLPFAADRDLARPPLEDGFLYDLFFLGTAWPNRVAAIRDLLAAADGRWRLKIGLPTNPHLPPVDLPLDQASYDWKAALPQFLAFARHSRTTLTLHRAFAGTRDGGMTASTPGPRIFETAVAGTAQLVEDGLDELSRYYEPGAEVLLVRDAGECVEALDRLTRDGGERRRLADRAAARTLAHHTYDHRVDALLATALERRTVQPVHRPRRRHDPPTILMVTHNAGTSPPYGGVEVYQRWIVESLGDAYDVLFYAPVRSGGGPTNETALCDARGRRLRTFAHDTPPDNTRTANAEREHVFSRLLCELAPSAIHYQHLLDHTLSLPLVSRALGIPSLLTIHDYFLLCTRYNLVGHDGRYCAAGGGELTACDICLNACQGRPAGTQASRLARAIEALEAVDRIHVAHPATLDIMRPLCGGLPDTGLEIFPMPALLDAKPTLEPIPDGPLHVAIPGNLTVQKGADALIHAINNLRDEPFVFHVLGNIEPLYREILATLALPNLVAHGGYRIADLPRLYQPATLSVHLSRWPETWCLALDEAWQRHVIPIVTGLGAPAARINDGVDGFVLPPDDPGALASLLRSLLARRPLLAAMRARIAARPLDTQALHRDRLGRIYANLCAADRGPIGGFAPVDTGLCRRPLASPPQAAAASPPQAAGPRRPLPDLLRRTHSYYRTHGLARTAAKVVAKLTRT